MMTHKLKSTLVIFLFLILNLEAAEFTKTIKPFLEKYCTDCHDNDVQKGDLSLHNLNNITVENAAVWKSVWEQVSLKEMPPRNKKKQPELKTRFHIAELITAELTRVMKNHGGFTENKKPNKGNHLDHELLFNTLHKNLEPASTPARIWRIHPQEQLVRLNDLINKEPEFNSKMPGRRTRGDHIVSNPQGDVKVYFGLDRYIGHVGGAVAYAGSVNGFPAILSTIRDHGFKNYPFMYSVNSSESNQIMNVAESIIRFMAYGPDAQPFQIAKSMKGIPSKYKDNMDMRGLPAGMFYSEEIKRPITPIYDLFNKSGVNDSSLTKAIQYLFEKLTLRTPNAKQIDFYLSLTKETIKYLGEKDGVMLGLTSIFLDRDALFRSELAEYGNPDKYGRVMLQGEELALAINGAFSYILPDQNLKKALTSGKLTTRADVRSEIQRILEDDKVRKPRILQFFKEYFEYDLCAYVCKDTKALSAAGGPKELRYYPGMNGMIASTDRLVELILYKDKNVLKELLTTDLIITGKGESLYYGQVEGSSAPTEKKKKKKGSKNRKAGVAITNQPSEKGGSPIYTRTSQFRGLQDRKVLTTVNKEKRMGILTHPSWLVSHSDAMNNHAILRGLWIRQRLLGDAVPDVPITVDAMLPDEPHKTLRHRMRVTREDECWRCHQKMDPLGLPFEMYNHLGLLRNQELGKPVDTSGAILLSGDPSIEGPVTDAIDMITKLASSERVEQVFVRHAFRYWMGRNETINDGPILQAAHIAYKNNNGSMKALLTSLLTSDAFLYRKIQNKSQPVHSFR